MAFKNLNDQTKSLHSNHCENHDDAWFYISIKMVTNISWIFNISLSPKCDWTSKDKISINFPQRLQSSYWHTQTLRSYPVIKVLHSRPLLTLIPSINPVVSEISQISTHGTAHMAHGHAHIEPIALTFKPVTSPLIVCQIQCQSCQSLWGCDLCVAVLVLFK